VLAFRLLGRWLLAHAPAGDEGIGSHRDRKGIAKLVLDERRRRVFLGDREIQLSAQEYRFLQVLVSQAGTVVARARLAASVWPDETDFDGGRDNRLSALVYRLRVTLGDEKGDWYIETRRGFGFSAVPQNVERVEGGEPR
jgi:DNA-binding response OmpR family regulator